MSRERRAVVIIEINYSRRTVKFNTEIEIPQCFYASELAASARDSDRLCGLI
jgi:hypothetical protein